MNTLRWSLCLWLWFMYAGVECWPKLRLLSRNEDNGPWTITISYIVDDSLKSVDENTMNHWIDWITKQTEYTLQSWFLFQITLLHRIIHSDEVPLLMSRMKPFKNTNFIYLERAIETLTDYFEDMKHPDVICLLTNYTISDGHMVTKAHGYYEQRTLCEKGVSVLLAYSPGNEGHAGSMLANMIMNSANPKDVPNLHYRRKGYDEEMKTYLRKCNGSLGLWEPDINQPEIPPPPAPPSKPEEPAPPEVPASTPETTKAPEENTPAPPPSPGPPTQPEPQPPVGSSSTSTTTEEPQEPELPTKVPPEVPPEEPKEPSSTEPATTTTAETPVADYC
uniref:Putative vegetative cell wall protein gp1 n=1 Tax=Ixodes ricinus TaxID=34613 RepID=A0A6B0VAY9_IXORI